MFDPDGALYHKMADPEEAGETNPDPTNTNTGATVEAVG